MNVLRKIFFLAIVSLLGNSTLGLNRCVFAPKWRLSNITFPNDVANADVKLLAFLKASCGFCQTQAKHLGELRSELEKMNLTKVAIIIVNSHHKDSYNKLDVFRNVTSIPVVQDQGKVNVWKAYRAQTDDMVIFDKCNRLVFHISLPDAVVQSGIVKASILRAQNENICGKNCNFPKPTTKNSNANMRKTTKKLTTTATKIGETRTMATKASETTTKVTK